MEQYINNFFVFLHNISFSRIFRNMDVDHSNWLSLKEFRDGIKDFGLSFPESSVEELFSYIDKDGQHGILFNEFLEALRVTVIKIKLTMSTKGSAVFIDHVEFQHAKISLNS